MFSTAIDVSAPKKFVSEPRQAHFGLPEYNPLLSHMVLTISQRSDDWFFEGDPPAAGKERLLGPENLRNIVRWQEEELKRHPLNYQAHLNFGLALETAGQLDQADSEFHHALELAPSDRNALLCLGRLKVTKGDLTRAAELFKKAIDRYPYDSTALMNLAQIYIRENNFDDASELLKRVSEGDANAPVALFLLGMTQVIGKNYRGAIRSLRRAGDRLPPSAGYHHLLGIAQFFNNQLRKSERSLKTCISLSPDSEAVLLLAHILLESSRAYEARVILERYTALVGKRSAASELLSRSYQIEGNFKRARQELEDAFRLCPETADQAFIRSRIANNIGACADHLMDLKGTERWLRHSILLCPSGNVLPSENLAKLYIRTGRLSEAKEVVSQALREFPDSRQLSVLWAVCLGEDGRYEESVSELKRELEREDCLAEALVASGNYLCEMGDYAKALAVLRRGREEYPDNIFIMNNLAYAYLMIGQLDDAKTVLAKLDSPQKSSPQMIATFGLLQLHEGHLNNARRLYKQAAAVAANMGNKLLGRMLTQKLHLELARHFIRNGKSVLAKNEIELGLAIPGRRSFFRELNEFKAATT